VLGCDGVAEIAVGCGEGAVLLMGEGLIYLPTIEADQHICPKGRSTGWCCRCTCPGGWSATQVCQRCSYARSRRSSKRSPGGVGRSRKDL